MKWAEWTFRWPQEESRRHSKMALVFIRPLTDVVQALVAGVDVGAAKLVAVRSTTPSLRRGDGLTAMQRQGFRDFLADCLGDYLWVRRRAGTQKRQEGEDEQHNPDRPLAQRQ